MELQGARVVVTGGAGFVGSHVCEALVDRGAEVVAVDNLITGRRANLAALVAGGRLTLVEHDVSTHTVVDGSVDAVLHLASPASPVDYLRYPIQTLKVGALGTHNTLGLARAKGARYLLASTSEVYGDPQVHPQPETYWGHVNPIGPRGVYDEAKRFAEAMALAYLRTHGLDVRIARIFNTYGPRLRLDDGRLVPSFLGCALRGTPLPVHGEGEQTRTLCHVDDTVAGLLALLTVPQVPGPVNIGGTVEVTVHELAELVGRLVPGGLEHVHLARPTDDPERRRPDLTRAREVLGWEPRVGLEEGLGQTLAWYRDRQ